MLARVETETNFGRVVVEIRGNGKIKIDRENEIGEQDKSLAIWKSYENYRSGDRVIRSGSGLCGVYDFNPEEPFTNDYVETDTIHSSTCVELANNIFEQYPQLFDMYDQFRITSLLRYHDLGEDERGDKPDDGSSSHEEKFEIELREFIKKIQYHTVEYQDILIRDFIIFEHAQSFDWTPRDREVFQFAKLCDKADAPLGAFIFEKQGRKGSLLYKKKHFGGITDQDEYYTSQTREYSQAAIWTAHMIDTYKEYEYLKIFVDVIAAACRDTRGMIFPWLWEFLTKRNLFTVEERETYAQ